MCAEHENGLRFELDGQPHRLSEDPFDLCDAADSEALLTDFRFTQQVAHLALLPAGQVDGTSGEVNGKGVRMIPGRKYLVFEEGLQGSWLYETLSPHVDEIVVAGITESRGSKSDKRDAYGLAEKLRMGNLDKPVFTGVVQRRISSTALGTSEGSRRSFSNSLGFSIRASRPPLVAFWIFRTLRDDAPTGRAWALLKVPSGISDRE